VHVLIWSVIGMLAAAWSLAAWAVHSLIAWIGDHGAGMDNWYEAIDRFTLPFWLEPWFSSETLALLKTLLVHIGPLLEKAVAAIPALLDWLTPLFWMTWGAGVLMLLALGALLSAIVRFASKTRPRAEA
jgi:hypothetical protein